MSAYSPIFNLRSDDAGYDSGLRLYAHGIDHSDYVGEVAAVIRSLGAVGSLLDVGAGGGQLGAALREGCTAWVAVEPDAGMRARLSLMAGITEVVPDCWTTMDRADRFDTVLAANIAAPLTDASAFLAWCRARSTRRIVWVVPAQHGPRGRCLAGLLPADWHGEDCRPGVDAVLGQLGPDDRPHGRIDRDWMFTLDATDCASLAQWLADGLGWSADDPRRPAMVASIEKQADPVPNGVRVRVPKTSAVLWWEVA